MHDNNTKPDRLRPWAVRLRVERTRRGWSRRDLAAQILLAARTLGIGGLPNPQTIREYSRRWEAGRVVPDWKHQVLLAMAYGRSVSELFGDVADPAIPPMLLAATGGTVEVPHFSQAEDSPMRRRKFVAWLAALAAGATRLPDAVRHTALVVGDQPDLLPVITSQDIANLDAANAMFTKWEVTVGGAISRQAVTAHLSWAIAQLTANVPGTPEARDGWRITTARLAQTAGWMCHDAGREQQARSLLLTGYEIASGTEDTHVAEPALTLLLSKLARQAVDVGRPETGLAIVRHAQGIAEGVSPTARYTLHAVKARAFGALGDRQSMQRELGLAEEEFGQMSPQDLHREPWSVSWQGQGQFHYNIGTAHRLLAAARPDSVTPTDSERTAEAFTASAAAFGAAKTRDWTSGHLRAAASLMAAGEPERAVGVARQTLPALPSLRSKRILDDAHALCVSAAPYRRSSDVDALVRGVRATTHSSRENTHGEPVSEGVFT